MKLRLAAMAAVAALAALTLAGCASASGNSPSSASASALDPDGGGNTSTFQGVGLIPARPRPQFELTDTAGKPYQFGTATKGRTTLLFFGYTNCPDICPATMADIGVSLRKLPVATAQKITVVFVSTDVKHDTGPVIKRWLENFSPNTHATFVGLHGTQAQVDAAQAAAHIFLAEEDGQTHSTQVLVFGPDDYAHDSFIYNDTTEQKQMEHDLPLVVKGTT